MPGRRRIDVTNYLVIGVGGFIGAITRYIMATWIGQGWGRSFPLGTFLINVSGSFLIGLVMALLTEKYMVNPQWRLFLIVGFLGAYTTFSTFEYETGTLLKDGELILGALNVILSVFFGFAALKIGQMLVKLL
jgi:CrcB protein